MSYYGGFTEAARYLNERIHRPRPFTRQQVYAWWRRRANNGFPEKYELSVDGQKRQLLMLPEIYDWWLRYVPSKGGRPRKKEEGKENDVA